MNIGIGADIILVILDIGKICAGKLIFQRLVPFKAAMRD